MRHIFRASRIEASVAAFWPRSIRIVDTDRSRRSPSAYVELSDAEYARALLEAYPGSAGAGVNAKMLMINDGAVGLESPGAPRRETPRERSYPSDRPAPRAFADWLCDYCNSTNFARRQRCFQCAKDRPPTARIVGDAEPRNAPVRYPPPVRPPYAAPMDHPYDAAMAPPALYDAHRRSLSPRRSRSPRATRLRALEWPPPFESDGIAYTFDAASGYFYEPRSGFYYDPKKKFYYNAHKQLYYHYTPQADPPFTRFENPAAAAPFATGASEAAEAEAAKRAEQLKKKALKKAEKAAAAVEDSDREFKKPPGPITFGLTKVAKPVATAASVVAAPKIAAPKVAVSHLLAVGTDYAQVGRLTVNEKPIVEQDEASGKWLCLVSRRQFPTEDQLQKHITKSNLYKAALEKAANEGKIVLN